METPFLQAEIGCTDIPNTIGIIGTPTIDPATDIAYFYAKTYIPNFRTAGQTGVFNGVYKFYAVDVKTLQDVPGFPILVDGSAADNDPRKYFVGGVILQRPSLVQIGNIIYAGFGGHCDQYNYTGTVLGVDITQKKVVANWVTEAGPQSPFSLDWQPNQSGGGGGIWQSGLGLASDGPRLFFVTGNGGGHENQGTAATGQSGCRTLGEAVVDLNVGDGGKLTTTDYFQPYDYQNMDGGDQDFGSGGISLLDTTTFKGTGVSRMAVTSGKNGKIYVLNADNLGGYKQGTGGTDLVIQTIVTNKAVFGGSGSYPLEGGYFYSTPVGYPTYAYKLGFDGSGKPVFSLAGQSPENSAGRVGIGIPTVTTNQGKPGSAILWLTDPDAGLRAWYAVPGSDGLLKSIKLPQVGGINKFQRPAFGDTRLYVSDANGVVYCLGSPVNLPLSCSAVDFGDVALGSSKTLQVTCTALIALNNIIGMSTGDARFEVSNSTLPQGAVKAGATFSFPVRWNLTTEVVANTPGASYGNVSPGIKTTPLTIFTNNAVAGYATIFPISLTGNEVSSAPYLSQSPNTVDFGGLVLGVAGEQPTSTLPFTLSNLGQQSLTILGYAYTTDEVDDPAANYTNATVTNGVWDLGAGFTATSLPVVGSTIAAGTSVSVELTFSAVNGVGQYLSYFAAYTNGGNGLTILEGSASTAPVANFSISTPEGGWVNTLTMDFGAVAPGQSANRTIRICNQGGSVLTVSKSKPPLGVIRAAVPGVDLHESQQIPVNTCATGMVIFAPLTEPPNVPDYQVTNTWTLNTDDLNFGVHEVQMVGTVHDRVVGPQYANGSARYLYLGCYEDFPGPRLEPNAPYAGNAQNENGMCQTACLKAGYAFAGTEYMQECWCGNTVPPGKRYHPESDLLCTFSCTGDSTQACGGNGGYLSLYYDSSKFTPTNDTFNNTNTGGGASTGGPITVNSTGNYNYVGCYSEGTNGRALTAKNVATPTDGGSVEYCMSQCQGFTYFGVEYSNECYCGNTIGAGSALVAGATVDATGCNMVCGGNSSEYCGGANRLNMYQVNSTAPTPSQSSTPTASPTGPVIVKTIGSYLYQDCYSEGTNGRALTGKTVTGNTITEEVCIAACAGFTYAGVEYGQECYCGNSLGAGSAPVTDGRCSMTCAANSTEICGGPNGLTLYMSNATAAASISTMTTAGGAAPTPTGPVVVQSAGTFSSIGCYNELNGGRAIQLATVANDSMTVEICAGFCNGYQYMGVEYGRECYCGNVIATGSAPATDNCNMQCAGNSLEICGGPNRLNMYNKTATVAAPKVQGPVSVASNTSTSTSTPIISSTLSTSVVATTAGSNSTTSRLTSTTLSTASTASNSTTAVASSTNVASLSTSSFISPTASNSSTMKTTASITSSASTNSSSVAGPTTTTSSSTSSKISSSSATGASTDSSTWSTPLSTSSSTGSSSKSSITTVSATPSANSTTTLTTLISSIKSSSGQLVIATSNATTSASSATSSSSSTKPSATTKASSSSLTPSSTTSTKSSSSPTVSSSTTSSTSSTSSKVTMTSANSTTISASSSTSSAATLLPTAGQVVNKYTYLGCANTTSPLALTGASTTATNMTQELCQSFCSSSKNNYGLAGTTNGDTCLCGNGLQSYSAVGFTDCNKPCVGNVSEICGATNRVSVWNATSAISPTTVKAVGAYVYNGCFVAPTTGDVLNGTHFTNTTSLTVESCVGYCITQNLNIGGVKGASDCYCGNSLSNSTTAASSNSSCNVVTSGNLREFGGGKGFVGVWKLDSTSVDANGKPKSMGSDNSATITPAT